MCDMKKATLTQITITVIVIRLTTPATIKVIVIRLNDE